MDRNLGMKADKHKALKSPPARVAWIETSYRQAQRKALTVATREGGVDRNARLGLSYTVKGGRHPRGWRG